MTSNKRENITIATIGIQIAARQKESRSHRVTAETQNAGLNSLRPNKVKAQAQKYNDIWQAVGPLLILTEGR